MTTKLAQPVVRETSITHSNRVVILELGQEFLRFRLKGTQRTCTVPLREVLAYALRGGGFVK